MWPHPIPSRRFSVIEYGLIWFVCSIGLVLGSLGRRADALEMGIKSLKITLKVSAKDKLVVAGAYNKYCFLWNLCGVTVIPDVVCSLGVALRNMDRYEEALDCYRKTLDIKLQVLGSCHPGTASAYNNIGNVYLSQHNYPEAMSYFKESLGIKKKVYHRHHPDIASTKVNMGCTLRLMKDLRAAKRMYEDALPVYEKNYGCDHMKVADLKHR